MTFRLLAFSFVFLFPSLSLSQVDNNTLRVLELESEVRRLTGQVEELNFRLLQTEESLRISQEDNELRFQQLEGIPPESSVSESTESTESIPDESIVATAPAPKSQVTLQSTLHFDDQGNLIESHDESNFVPIESDDIANYGTTPAEVFASGKTSLEVKSYTRSESAFRAFLTQWPDDPRSAEARYYLGQSLFSQRNYFNAANVYLSNHNDHPDADIAPDNLLGLALSLAGLNQREVACVTYGEVLRKYPDAKTRLGDRILAEQTGTRCNPPSQNR